MDASENACFDDTWAEVALKQVHLGDKLHHFPSKLGRSWVEALLAEVGPSGAHVAAVRSTRCIWRILGRSAKCANTIAGSRGTDFWRRPGEHAHPQLYQSDRLVRSQPLPNCTTPQHLWCGRISKPCQDFSRRASREATVKAKDGISNNPCISGSLENTTLNNNQFLAPGQKQHQLSEDAHLVLFDNCCLWTWMRKKMVSTFSGQVVEKHDKLFSEGLLTFTRQSSFPVGPGSQNFQMLWLSATALQD